MGGSLNYRGNRSPIAEANVVDDPEAAHVCFNSNWEIVLVPLNVTEQLQVTQEFMNEMAQNEIGAFLAEISKVYFLFSKF